jgi:UDP:flavonoid glycosyltransferase YjiC (YdhE family)
VVIVAQGTVETEPTELIIPTLQHLSNHSNVLTVAILGSRGATLSSFEVPDNARIADYLVYDAVLPYADLWVHNGGYGATTHGISHGVPQVIAGEGQDKPESAKRVAYSGIGIDLGCARPGIERLGKAIDRVLEGSGFRDAARRLKETAEGMDCVRIVEDEVLRIVAQGYTY